MHKFKEAVDQVQQQVPFNNMTYLFQHAGIETPPALGGNCSHMVERVKELCASERDLVLRSIQAEDYCHEAVVCEDSSGEMFFADPSFYMTELVSLPQLFKKGGRRVRSFPRYLSMWTESKFEPKSSTCFGVKRVLFGHHAMGGYTYDLQHGFNDRAPFHGARNVEIDEMVSERFRYDVLLNGRAGKIYFSPENRRISVGLLGDSRMMVSPENVRAQKLLERICKVSGIDPEELKVYFEIAAGIQTAIFEDLRI
jgi:hypothetical protein